MKMRCRRHGGFTLVEILVVMEALAIALGFGVLVLAGALRVWKTAASAQNHLNERAALADQFRADVRQATAAPELVGTWTAGPTCLVLRRPGGKYLVYRYQNERLERVELPAGTSRWVALGADGVAVEFIRGGEAKDLVTLRLAPARPQVLTARVLEFAAALGGDLR